jgi:hypothetical protein
MTKMLLNNKPNNLVNMTRSYSWANNGICSLLNLWMIRQVTSWKYDWDLTRLFAQPNRMKAEVGAAKAVKKKISRIIMSSSIL